MWTIINIITYAVTGLATLLYYADLVGDFTKGEYKSKKNLGLDIVIPFRRWILNISSKFSGLK